MFPSLEIATEDFSSAIGACAGGCCKKDGSDGDGCTGLKFQFHDSPYLWFELVIVSESLLFNDVVLRVFFHFCWLYCRLIS